MGTHSNSMWGPISWKRRIFELHHLDHDSTSSNSIAAPSACLNNAAAATGRAETRTTRDATSDERLSLVYFDIDPMLPDLKTKIHALLVAEKSTRDVGPLRANRAALELEYAHRKAKSRKGEIILLKGATTFQVDSSLHQFSSLPPSIRGSVLWDPYLLLIIRAYIYAYS